MNEIEEKYAIVNQQLPTKCFALSDDVTFDPSFYGDRRLIKYFIVGCIGLHCCAVASITQSNQIFVIHNIFYSREIDTRHCETFYEDVIFLLNSGRKIMLVAFQGEGLFYIKKKEGIEIDNFSTFDDVHFEAKTNVSWMSKRDKCDVKIEHFPNCDNKIEVLENLHKDEVLQNILRLLNNKKVRALFTKYPRRREDYPEPALFIYYNSIPIIIPNNPRPEVYTPEAFMIGYTTNYTIDEDLINEYDYDAISRDGELYIYFDKNEMLMTYQIIRIRLTSVFESALHSLELYS